MDATFIKISPRNLFLVDALGAFLTASLLIFVLAQLESIFGVNKVILYYLALIAFLFSIYSLSCFIFFPKNWKVFLRIIAILNLAYCIVTGTLLILKSSISILGISYFIAEIIVVIILAIFELKMASKAS